MARTLAFRTGLGDVDAGGQAQELIEARLPDMHLQARSWATQTAAGTASMSVSSSRARARSRLAAAQRPHRPALCRGDVTAKAQGAAVGRRSAFHS